MTSFKATSAAAALATILAIVFSSPIARSFAPPLVPACCPSGGRARSSSCGPLRATESFQRSLLEAQFANSAPDSAPDMVDVDDDATTTIAEESPVIALVNVVVGGGDDDIASVQNSMLRIAASTDRGQNADAVQKERASRHIASLEKSNNAPERRRRYPPPSSADVVIPPHLAGTWELLYSNTQLFRSSPFFLAGRSTCKTPEQARQYDWFCDMHRAALAISTIGTVRQIISRNGRLVNEFEVRVGAVPFLSDFLPGLRYSGGLPFTIDGAIVSTADAAPSSSSDNNAAEWELYMDTVEIKGSNVPFLRNLLDSENVALRSRDLSKVLKDNVDGYDVPRPVLRTTYVDDGMRIVRDVDDNVFVYGRVSDSEVPTDYSGVMPDLGVASLLEGFNDAVAKIYL
jgi:hypothetical protein